MDRINGVAFVGLVLSATLISLSYERTFVFDRPVHSTVTSLAIAGIILLVLGRYYPALFKTSAPQEYSAIPLTDRNQHHPSRESSPAPQNERSLSPRIQRTLLAAAAVALVIRIELFRRVMGQTECSRANVETVIPVLISFYDYWRNQRPKNGKEKESYDDSIYDIVVDKFTGIFKGARWQFIPAALLMTWGGAVASSLGTGPTTYICPAFSGHRRETIHAMQWTGLFLDSFLLIAATELAHRGSGNSSRAGRGPVIWGWVFLAVAAFWSLVGLGIFIFKSEWRTWMIPSDVRYLRSTIYEIFLFTVLILSSAHLVLHLDILSIIMTLATIFIYVPELSTLRNHRQPFPPLSGAAMWFSVLLVYIGIVLYIHLRFSSETGRRHALRPNALVYLFLFIWFGIGLIYGVSRPDRSSYHPIDMLIFNGRVSHARFVQGATKSTNLQEAIQNYQERYKMLPPPGFPEWYTYAQMRGSLIIDDFDQIHEDLLPFWAIEPNILREETWRAVSNPWNEIAMIKIRSGVPSVQDPVLPTHRWMLDGIVQMVEPFAKFLPDMDLPFNLNDESRVTVPWNDLQRLKATAKKNTGMVGKEISNLWSVDRASTWIPVSEETIVGETRFIDSSFRNTFDEFGSIGCPPGSPARRDRIWNHKNICTSCVTPHSLGQFLSNWTIAADICHQPDLAHLHGFYMSPAAFKTSHNLIPVFSQGKPSGYNDILYPSSWNYIDKVKYEPTRPNPENPDQTLDIDPPFASKQGTLFWRGATSEGVSADGSWRGMTRQRLVHLANNLTGTSPQTHNILLPHPNAHGRYSYATLTGPEIAKLSLSASIHIVDKIARCGLSDCPDQRSELGLTGPSDFQDHWQYKYLFDMDGAGFSGRFLPFLQSHSLPFRTALFRTWYDSRITAWRHFVPQDIRLHSVFSTLAYFAGVGGVKVAGQEGVFNGETETVLGAHHVEAEMIAEEGRKWAGEVLRKSDMEVYFFRLLLEWGRLTDDRRAELGVVNG